MFRELLRLLSPKQAPSDPSKQRRAKIRLRCGIKVRLGTSEALRDAVVINVSSTGLCVETDASVKPKGKVKLHKRPFGGALQGRVAWCRPAPGGRRHRLGIVFEADEKMLRGSWLVPALEKLGYRQEDDEEKRKQARVAGRVGCFIHCFDSNMHFPCAFVDLSEEGALVEGMWPLPVGEQIRFSTDPIGTLAPLEGLATVVNQKCLEESPPKWHCGVKFTQSNPGLTQKYVKAMSSSR